MWDLPQAAPCTVMKLMFGASQEENNGFGFNVNGHYCLSISSVN